MEKITTKHIKGQYSKIEEPIILEETEKTRTFLKCAFTPQGVNGELWRQKKMVDGTFLEKNEVDFRKKEMDGCSVKIDIPTKGMINLAKDLYTLFKVRKEYGVEFGEQKYITGKEDEFIKVTDKNKKEIIEDLINKGYSQDFFKKIEDLDPKALQKISKATIQEKREEDVKEFESSIIDNNNEGYWQHFFENKKWIFGYGLNYKILKQVQSQPNYGGASYTGKGGQRGDYLTATEGTNKYTVLVEIKTPLTNLLKGSSPHHSGAWSLSDDLTNAITQLQANIDTWNTEGSTTPKNVEELSNQRTFTVTPKGILVIGKQKELENDRSKRRTFERFRQSINGIEVITFDELLERAKFITKE